MRRIRKRKVWHERPFPTWPGQGGLNRYGIKTSNLDSIDSVENNICLAGIYIFIGILFLIGFLGLFF